jgi:hypothetical protein
MYDQEISYRAALRKIITAGGKIMSARFVKEDGSIRDMTFRRNVASQVKNNPDNTKNDSRLRVKRGSVITVVEMDGNQDRKWKSINLQTLRELRVNGEIFKIGSRAYQ